MAGEWPVKSGLSWQRVKYTVLCQRPAHEEVFKRNAYECLTVGEAAARKLRPLAAGRSRSASSRATA